MRHASSLLYHVCAVASRNIRFASCGTSGENYFVEVPRKCCDAVNLFLASAYGSLRLHIEIKNRDNISVDVMLSVSCIACNR
jgi:hypothetical protein